MASSAQVIPEDEKLKIAQAQYLAELQAQEIVEPLTTAPATVGPAIGFWKIAFAVMVGNLMAAAVVGVLWYGWTH